MPIASRAALSTKVFYGAGATAFGIKDAGFNSFLLIYYNQVLGLDPFLTGLALALAVALDAASDLPVGYLTDHWHSRWGRRHPFMYAAVAPTAIAFFYLWNPPAGVLDGDPSSLFLYLLAMTTLVRTCLTFFEVPNAAQGPELTTDYHDRTRLMAFRYLFGWLGGLGIAVLGFMVLFNLDPAGQMGPTGYQWIGVIGALVMFVMMLVSAIGTHHQIPTYYQPPKRDRHTARMILDQFRALFRNTSFNAVLVSGIFFGAAAGLSQSLTIYVTTFFWRLLSTEIGVIPLLGLLAVPTAFFLAPRLSARWDKRGATMRVYGFAILYLPLVYIAQFAGVLPPRDSAAYVPLLMANYLVETTALIVVQIVFASMNADVVEDRSAETGGGRDEGVIFAARNFVKKAISGVGIMLAGLVLSIVGFPDGAKPGEVPEATVAALVLVYLPVLLTLYAASWYALRFYRIDRARHETNLAAVAGSARSALAPEQS
jgi:GPH family glycoside/pentoside/hexuronide:cation symporter